MLFIFHIRDIIILKGAFTLGAQAWCLSMILTTVGTFENIFLVPMQ